MTIKCKNISLAHIGLFFFLMAMYSIGTVSAISVSWTPTYALLILADALFLINTYVAAKRLYISKLTVVWIILSLLCFSGVIRGSSATVLVFYLLSLFLLFMGKMIGVEILFQGLNWIRIIGIVFAAGCYWQLFFPDQYYAWLFPLFGSTYQDSIRRQFTMHRMCTGFTFQTAVSAQFIILGLMAAIYLYSHNKSKRKKIIHILEIGFLTIGLLLTGKRSPIINLGAALIVVDMLTVKRSKKGNRILFIVLGIITILTALNLMAPFLSESRNSLVRFLELTNYDDIGEISNGRTTLYASAINEFLRSPIIGIGWGKYSRLYNMTGVHNIYLQLLCECGLGGFIISVGGMIFTLLKTIKILKKQLEANDEQVLILLKCSIFIQVYIMVYGLFGNPLYDQNYLLMYCIGILLAIAAPINRVNNQK